jgi:hypothetical protein
LSVSQLHHRPGDLGLSLYRVPRTPGNVRRGGRHHACAEQDHETQRSEHGSRPFPNPFAGSPSLLSLSSIGALGKASAKAPAGREPGGSMRQGNACGLPTASRCRRRNPPLRQHPVTPLALGPVEGLVGPP